MAFQQEARSLGWAQSQPSALVGRADPFPGCVRRHVAVAGSLCIGCSPQACRASPALVHPWLALVLTALRCPSCEAAGPLLPTGPAGLLLQAVQGLPLPWFTRSGHLVLSAPSCPRAQQGSYSQLCRACPCGCLCAESQPEGPRCAPPPRRSPGAAQAVVPLNSGPQASSWILRGPAGTVGPGKQVALHPVQAWPQAGGFGGCAATAAVRGRGRLRRVEARWRGR